MDLPVPRRRIRLGDRRRRCSETDRTNQDRVTELDHAAAAPGPWTTEVRAWAREDGLPVPDRGRHRPEIWQAWHDANDAN